MPPTIPRILITPSVNRFSVRRGWLGGWMVMESIHVVAITQQKEYAEAIALCLNIVLALYAHLPIKLCRVKTDSAN